MCVCTHLCCYGVYGKRLRTIETRWGLLAADFLDDESYKSGKGKGDKATKHSPSPIMASKKQTNISEGVALPYANMARIHLYGLLLC